MRHRIYLLRHAKSSWDQPDLADHERPLAKRGRKAVAKLGRHFRDAGVRPDLVLCSSAARAVETLDGVREALPPEAELEVEGDLYGAGSDALLTRLRRVPDEVGSAMLIGHNPAIEELALELAGEEDDGDARARMEAKYPTGALATLRFEGSWGELEPGAAALEAFVVPRELG